MHSGSVCVSAVWISVGVRVCALVCIYYVNAIIISCKPVSQK